MGLFDPYIMDELETKELKDHCSKRFERYSNPCKYCSYRSRVTNPSGPVTRCMFSNCPCDWKSERDS